MIKHLLTGKTFKNRLEAKEYYGHRFNWINRHKQLEFIKDSENINFCAVTDDKSNNEKPKNYV